MTIICFTQKLNPTINKKEIAWKRICFDFEGYVINNLKLVCNTSLVMTTILS